MPEATENEELSSWEFFVDTGGTFTDCLGRDPQGNLHRAKVLSRGTLSAVVSGVDSKNALLLAGPPDWPEEFPVGFGLLLPANPRFEGRVARWEAHDGRLVLDCGLPSDIAAGTTIELLCGDEAPVLGMRLILARNGADSDSAACRMRLATTRCTNALLEGAGSPPVLFLTAGFPDLLEIGDQRRAGLFDLVPRKRASLEGRVVQVDERTDRSGQAVRPPDPDSVLLAAREALEQGHRTAAVSFMNSCLNDENERAVVSLLREAGFDFVVGSGETHPFPKWLPRCESAVTEAYLSPVLSAYLDSVGEGMGERGDLLVTSSSGGLIDRAGYRAIDSLLSGPAGGVVGAGATARAAGLEQFINLDMGGTSSDARHSGSFAYRSPHQVGDARISSIAMKTRRWPRGRLICGSRTALAGRPAKRWRHLRSRLQFRGAALPDRRQPPLGRLEFLAFPPVSPKMHKTLAEMVEQSGRPGPSFWKASGCRRHGQRHPQGIHRRGLRPLPPRLQAFGGAGGQHARGRRRRDDKILSPADSGLLSAGLSGPGATIQPGPPLPIPGP